MSRRGLHRASTGSVADRDAGQAPALELREISAAYERVEVLSGISLTIPAGQVFALLGPNGAGKSTTLRVASGRLHPKAAEGAVVAQPPIQDAIERHAAGQAQVILPGFLVQPAGQFQHGFFEHDLYR